MIKIIYPVDGWLSHMTWKATLRKKHLAHHSFLLSSNIPIHRLVHLSYIVDFVVLLDAYPQEA